MPYFDEAGGNVMAEQMGHPCDLLLGRKTYDIFARYWPQHNDEIGGPINRATKCVVSHKPVKSDWKTTVHIGGDVPAEIKKLKQQDGPELQVHGSANLIQTLLEHGLIDEFRLWTFPLVLGTGKRLFDGGAVPAGLELASSQVSSTGVVIATYRSGAEIKYGSFAAETPSDA